LNGDAPTAHPVISGTALDLLGLFLYGIFL
jgi:hypothetical protein